MSSQVLSEEFAAVMHRYGGSPHRSRATSGGPPRTRYQKPVPSQTRRTKDASHACGNDRVGPLAIADTPSIETDLKLSVLQMKYETVVQGFQVLEARFEDSQKKLAIAEEQVRSNEEQARSAKEQIHETEEQIHELKERIDELKEQVRSAETRSAMLAAEAGVVRNELTAFKSVRKFPPPSFPIQTTL
ncbi:hypothetical protein BJ322DRAFT_1103525 [Thelephora terrestris]|uniref:Uncharacterized protein n=1 Tax=Thelephora terrestris TaxID=56493 RepID=A0A9P6HQV6_9AGAM|nr:hypothetical protein BJ322DRAFT_1103525 [Thelephora terrestris]